MRQVSTERLIINSLKSIVFKLRLKILIVLSIEDQLIQEYDFDDDSELFKEIRNEKKRGKKIKCLDGSFTLIK